MGHLKVVNDIDAINHTPKFSHSNLFKPISLVFQLKMLIQRSDNI